LASIATSSHVDAPRRAAAGTEAARTPGDARPAPRGEGEPSPGLLKPAGGQLEGMSVDGDATLLSTLLSLLDDSNPNFPIVSP
jgi:hypothetical protein